MYYVVYTTQHYHFNIIQTLTGNTDQDTVVRNEVRVFEAMYLRFRPQEWNGHISMRVEVYGCPQSK